MTDLVVSEGYAAAGYSYINVDDCWLEKNRGANNELVADRRRFPSGMRSLADYVSFFFSFRLIEQLFNLTLFRFMGKDSNLAFMKIMATTHALATLEFSAIQNKTLSSLHRGMLIM